MPDFDAGAGSTWPAAAVAVANGRVNGHRAAPPATDTVVATPAPPPTVDYAAVRSLRAAVARELTASTRDLSNVSAEYRAAEGERIAARLVRVHVDTLMAAGQPVSQAEENALLDAVAADLFGLGRLQLLLKQADIINIHILGCDRVRIEHADGRVTEGDPVADTDEELINMLQVLAMRAGATERSLSAAKPWLDMQLPDGSRLTAVYQVAVRPYVAIRRHTLMDVSLEDLRDTYGAMDAVICDFLSAAMAANLNIMIAGLADAGKTTMLRALAREIPGLEQYVKIGRAHV